MLLNSGPLRSVLDIARQQGNKIAQNILNTLKFTKKDHDGDDDDEEEDEN